MLALGGVFLGLILLFCIEWLAPRAPATPNPSPQQLLFFRDASRPFFRLESRKGHDLLVQNSRHQLYPSPQTISLAKPSSKRRIIVIGESSGQQVGEKLKDYLSRPESGGAFEIVNCAIAGACLEHVARIFDEIVAYSPDAVVICFGHNLEGYYFPLSQPGYLLLRLTSLSSLLRISPKVPIPHPDRLKEWEKFLRHAAETARKNRFFLTIYTLQGNLRYLPTGPSNAEDDPLLTEAAELARKGETEKAISDLKGATGPKTPALRNFRLAELLENKKRYNEAYRHFVMAQDADPGRVKSAQNKLTRRIAGEEGFSIADLQSIVDRQAPNGIPGWETFGDNCHILEDRRSLLVRACLDAFSSGGWPSRDFDWTSFSGLPSHQEKIKRPLRSPKGPQVKKR